MATNDHRRDDELALDQILGYLNFSSGAPDPNLLASLNQVWEHAEPGGAAGQQVTDLLRGRLAELERQSPAFQDSSQASAALELVFAGVLPAYRRAHPDLLFHQTDETLFNAFAVGRVCEAVLQQGAPWGDVERIVAGAVRRLNDFVGYRPVPALQSRKIEPYPQEWVRPVPLFVRGAGCAVGPYREVVQLALQLLRDTDDRQLRAAQFDPEKLDELAIDPRAYDFDHPVNKRPNYHFGQWDPHCIDNGGYYRRFVVRQVTLDALMQRLEDCADLPRNELQFEAAAVLAGTILMASGISGSGPGAHDSTTSLASLLPRIADYRDEFYEQLLQGAEPGHLARLEQEAVERRQPFGAARQHLNAELARRRASQLEHVQLARLFARMGYAEAAAEQARVVPAASARIACDIDCRLTATRQALDAHEPSRAAERLPEVTSLLHRGIQCGAIIDPWSILGFDAQFSLFPALENSVHDHRADELVELMSEVFGLYARAWAEAAALDQIELCESLAHRFHELALWWRQFAAHEVSGVEAIDPLNAYRSAEHVARALNLWHKGGAASGDIGFWAPHAELFDSPQAYALVIEALLEREDYVACMGLLIHWLGESAQVPLEQGESSFHRLAEHWLVEITQSSAEQPADWTGLQGEQWSLVAKFFDYLEANADQLWQVPEFLLGSPLPENDESLAEPEAAGDESLFGAAYENMVYRDSADDGIEGELFDSRQPAEDELAEEARRVGKRLAFLTTLARLWRIVALRPLSESAAGQTARAGRTAALQRWSAHAADNRGGLLMLLDSLHAYRISRPLADHDSLLEYDRQRVLKETLIEQALATTVETIDAARLLAAARAAEDPDAVAEADSDEEQSVVLTLAAIFRHDLPAVEEGLDELLSAMADLPLLYVPLAKGGMPGTIAAVRARQRYIQFLLKCLPRLGSFLATCRLIETARDMERNNPVGPGAVTEFDELFKIGFRALVHALVDSAECWQEDTVPSSKPETLSSPLVTRLEQLTEALLISWLAHSRTLRLSVVEKAADRRAWARLVSFIERYGGDLFSQRFLNIGNIRAILHQGCDRWLEELETELRDEAELRLLSELNRDVARDEAVEHLSLVLETIVENYGEYRDYNSTTTQSDRGEMLYTLLDFLRLRARYDRVCWNLKPVVLAHEILVRRRCKRAAQIWRRALRERISDEADKFEKKLLDLQRKYAMQLPSIADRISERFVRPMIVDRLCSLVEPAMREATQPCPHPTFRILQYEVEFLTREPSGVGYDVPVWLLALEEEIQRVTTLPHEREDYDELELAVRNVVLSQDEIEAQLNDWATH